MKRISSPCNRVFFGLLFLLLPMQVWASPPAIDFYMADAPPLTMLDQGSVHGITGDIALKAMKMAGYEAKLISLPWPRQQREVEFGKDLLIAPLSRTQTRENSYTWIAPVMTMDRAFFSMDRTVDSFEEAKKTFKLIAVGLGSAQEKRLYEEGFPASQIYPLKIGDSPAQLLLKGRVDAWFNGVPETRYIWARITDKPLKMSRVMMTADLYLACSKDCNPKMVEALRDAIESMRDDGTIDRVADSYLENLVEH
jgi:polar amino acid transport system substrate-binding protein